MALLPSRPERDYYIEEKADDICFIQQFLYYILDVRMFTRSGRRMKGVFKTSKPSKYAKVNYVLKARFKKKVF